MYLPRLGLVVQVDGEQHMLKQADRLLHDTSSHQYYQDRRCDLCVLLSADRHVHGILRIHYKDAKHARSYLSKAMAKAESSICNFVMYSTSYKGLAGLEMPWCML